MKRSCLENIFQKTRQSFFKSIPKAKVFLQQIIQIRQKFPTTYIQNLFLIINYFGRQINLFFSSKGSYNAEIKLTDEDEIIQNEEKVAETLNSFFKNAVSSLKLNVNSFVINNEHKNIQDPTEKIIVKYQLHSSILIIKNKIENTNTFCFKHVDIKNEINGLNPNKATTHNNIPPKIIQESVKVNANTSQLLFGQTISNSEFPEK